MQNFIISISKYNDKKFHNYNMFSNLDKEQKTLQTFQFQKNFLTEQKNRSPLFNSPLTNNDQQL